MLRFGWPLFLNGFLMFAYLQGDQLLIAASYSMSDLAAYAAAAALAMVPTVFVGRILSSVLLPILAAVQNEPVRFCWRYRQSVSISALLAASVGVGMALGGECAMRLVYGAKYAGSGALLAWLSAANALRTLRLAPALAAIAKGDSKNQLLSNAARTIAILPAAVLALAEQPIWTIACSGLLGELIASWFSFARLSRRDGIPLSRSLVPGAWLLVSAVGAAALLLSGIHRLDTAVGLPLAALSAAAIAAAMVAALPELRNEALAMFGHWRLHGVRGLSMWGGEGCGNVPHQPRAS
jgi:O-antigen/teichoic acid export membrane protein